MILNGRYRIAGQIGEGAYGAVYRAEHTALGVTRAVKYSIEALAGRTSAFADGKRVDGAWNLV
jgi:serine/threonine protein kinase